MNETDELKTERNNNLTDDAKIENQATIDPDNQMTRQHSNQGKQDDSLNVALVKKVNAIAPSGRVAYKRGMTMSRQKTYTSRRDQKFDDDESHDEAYQQTESVDNSLQFKNTQGQVVSNKPNSRFKNYKEIFNNLLKSTNVTTMYPICSVIISYDSTRAITVTKANEREYYVKMYDLESYELTFEEKIGGRPDCYIKIKEVE